MKLQVEKRMVYGNELVYPVCDKAKLFADLLGKKTFGYHDIETIKRLGYTFESGKIESL